MSKKWPSGRPKSAPPGHQNVHLATHTHALHHAHTRCTPPDACACTPPTHLAHHPTRHFVDHLVKSWHEQIQLALQSKKSLADDRRLLVFWCLTSRRQTTREQSDRFEGDDHENCGSGDKKFVAFSRSCDFFQKITKIAKNALRGNPDLQFLVCFLLVR